jgi:hypothetical protein
MYWKHWLPGRETWIYYLIVIIFFMSLFNSSGGKMYWAKPLIERRLENKMGSVSSDLRYKDYRAIEDSIRRKVQDDNIDNLSTSGWGVGPFGVSKKKTGNKWVYYFYSNGYNLQPSADYYSEDGKNYIEWWEFRNNLPAVIHKDETSLRIIREEKETDKVLVPISGTVYYIIQTLFFIIIGLMLYYTFKIFFGYTRQLLRNISKGIVFTYDNIYFLRMIAIYLLVLGIVPAFLKVIVNLILQSSIPPLLHFEWYNALVGNSGSLIGGLIMLLLVKAFKQGEALLEEHDLTV